MQYLILGIFACKSRTDELKWIIILCIILYRRNFPFMLVIHVHCVFVCCLHMNTYKHTHTHIRREKERKTFTSSIASVCVFKCIRCEQKWGVSAHYGCYKIECQIEKYSSPFFARHSTLSSVLSLCVCTSILCTLHVLPYIYNTSTTI